MSWKGTLVQYAGRLHRLHPGKREVRIVDYVDGKVPMLARMFERRRVGYRAMGYREDDNDFLGVVRPIITFTTAWRGLSATGMGWHAA